MRQLKQILLFALIATAPVGLLAESKVSEDFKNLGGNEEIIRRAKELDPRNRVRIVQNRLVDRNWRVEVGVTGGLVAGGDSYLNTRNMGANLDLHINPRWSVGLRWYRSFNQLTKQGEQVFKEAAAANAKDAAAGLTYDIDYPIDTKLAVINWYPIYGKLNIFDLGVSQFDIYALVGAGQVQLDRGPSETYTVGGGVGLWLTQHLSTRFELRYQRYQDQVYTGPRDLDLTIMSASIGLIF